LIKQAYESLFSVDLTSEDAEAAARFSTHVTKLAISGRAAGISDFIKSAFANAAPAVIAELTALTHIFVTHGTDIEKQAFAPMLSGLQATLASLPLKELQKLRADEEARTSSLHQALADIVKTHPQLAGDQKSLAEHFDVMARFAPDVASSSVLSGNILSQLHKLGPGALTHQMIGELRKIQEGLDTDRQNRVKQTIDAVSPFTRLPS
jgi:hypothetical protein